jgi:hypothetical protein
MVSQKTIKSLDLETIEDYFNYIVESRVNGQIQQSRELYHSMSERQKKEFESWFLTFYHYDGEDYQTPAYMEYHHLLNILN